MKIAAIMTVYRPSSHADVIVSRWLRPREGDQRVGWTEPRTGLASFHIDQCPHNDMCHAASREFNVPIYPTVREALTLGGPRLAVDAVLLIGEHGEYPENEFGQKLYPRKRLFDEVMDVVEESGRAIPIFFDKHLSWSFELAQQMHERIKRLGVPFFGGSSLPFCDLEPALGIEVGAAIREAVVVYPGTLEPYLFHALELVQTVLERRQQGEQGITRVCAYRDDAVRQAVDTGPLSADLLRAAVAAISKDALVAFDQRQGSAKHGVTAFRLEYVDDLAVTILHSTGVFPEQAFRQFALAVRLEGEGPLSIRAARAVMGGADDFHIHFARLCREIEAFFLSRRSPVPFNRLLLTTGATEACMRALGKPGEPGDTPHLRIAYTPSASLHEASR